MAPFVAGQSAGGVLSRLLHSTLAHCPTTVSQQRLARLSRFVLLVAALIPFLGFLPELLWPTPDLNDGAFHLGVARGVISALHDGGDPLDPWFPTWLAGFPLFHYYQPGPYFFLAGLYFLTLGKVPLLLLLRVATLGALTLFPLATYRALRWLEQPVETASCGAFLCTMIAANGKFGIELESFTWWGYGLFGQAIALPLLPLALAGGWRALRGGEGGRRTLGHAALLAGALLTHILYGYIAAVSVALAVFMCREWRELGGRLVGLARLGLQTFLLVSFFVVPLALHQAFHLKSLYDEASKFDSHGAATILTWLLGGTLLDYGRLPVLTCLTAAGLYLCARRFLEERSPVDGWLVCGFVLWLMLYFGRATWGRAMDLLPLSKGLHLERLSSGVHLFAILLGAVALGRLARFWLGLDSRSLRVAMGCGIGALLLIPMGERAAYLARNANGVRVAKARFDADYPDLRPVLDRLRQDPLARVHAGHSGNWGKSYKVGDVPMYHVLSAEAIPTIGHLPFSWALSADCQFLFDPSDRASYDLYNVRYLLTDQAWIVPPGGELVVQSGRHRLWRVTPAGPFSLVSVPLAVEGDKEATWYMNWAWGQSLWSRTRAHARLLLEGGSGPGPRESGSRQVIRMADPFRFGPVTGAGGAHRNVFDPPGIFIAPAPPPAPGSITESRETRGAASATLHLEEQGVVLFKCTFHPWWRASLDGGTVPTMVLNPGFVGVEVPAGVHRLEMAYLPGPLKPALLLAGLLGAIGLDRRWLPRVRGGKGSAERGAAERKRRAGRNGQEPRDEERR